MENNYYNLKKDFSIENKNVHIVLHVSAWLIFIILPQFVINRYWGENHFIPWSFFANIIIYGILFYINYLWLIPRFYLNGKRLWYLALVVVVIVLLFLLNSYLDDLLKHGSIDKPMPEPVFSERPDFSPKKKPPEMSNPPPKQQLEAYFFLLISFIVTGFSLGLKLIQDHAASEKRHRELEREKVKSELAFLKNQISPHFFFNTLNNIYSLVEISTKDAQNSILKLSKLMRYLLYESEEGETHLEQEIEFMKHYIDLMKLRLSKKVKVETSFPKIGLDYHIPPLLFIPFIENAFKYGISYREKSFIKIYMQSEKNKVFFHCINSQVKNRNYETPQKYSGIGLENVKKRLNLIFPGKHVLKIDETGEVFTVSLEIELKPNK